MTNSITDFAPLKEAIRDPAARQSIAFPILGIRVCFESNCGQVLGLAEEMKRSWLSVQCETGPASGLTVRIIVRDGHEGANGHAEVRHISTDDGRLLIQSPASVGVVDPVRREALAYVTTELVADRAHFQSTVFEAMTFALLASRDRHPIHAAAVGGPGFALLLAGESGAGKSTLAYLAHANGMPVLSEDRVWVGLEPSLRIWSSASCVHLRREALAHFADLGARVGHIGLDGGKVAMSVVDDGERLSAPARRAVVCILAREHEAALDRVDAATLIAELQRQTAAGFDRFPGRHSRVLEAISAGGGWRMALSSSPIDALPLLKRMLEES